MPFTSFSGNKTLLDGKKAPVWFAFDEIRLLAFFAGTWTLWSFARKVEEGETANDLLRF